jgi:hypothetical protein
MATVGPYYSTEYDLLYRTLPADVGVHRNKRSHKRIERFSYAQAATGTDGDLVYAVKVPGVSRILLPELFIYMSDWTTSTTLDVGWDAYTEVDGDAVAADPDGLIDGLDISNGGVAVFFGMVLTVTTTNTLTIVPAATIDKEFNSRHPVDITFTIAGAAPLAAAVLHGYVTLVV